MDLTPDDVLRKLESALQDWTTDVNHHSELRQLAEELSAPAEPGTAEVERLRAELAQLRQANQALEQEAIRLRTELARVRDERAGVAMPPDEIARQFLAPDAAADYRGRLGEMLMVAGIISTEQLQEALEQQGAPAQRHLGEILVEKGYTSEHVVAKVLACQLGIPFMRLGQTVLPRPVVRLLPARLARQHAAIPVDVDGDKVTLAMANPLDLLAIEDVERATEKPVKPVVAAREDILASIERHYGPE